jgi:hypothetical protein
VIEAISPAKDVDGFHVASAGALMVGQPGFKALHALRLHEDARKPSATTCAASTRWSSAAATSWASPWR